jgi:hypothetical protein
MPFGKARLFERCHPIFLERGREPDDTLRLISLSTPYARNSWLSSTVV